MNPNLKVKADARYYARARTWPSLFSIGDGATVLDIGCGQGLLGRYLADAHSAKVTGIEIIEANAIVASTVLHRCVVADIETMDVSVIGDMFDHVIFSDCLEHLVDPQAALEKVTRLLNPGGSLLISIPNVRNFRVTLPLLFGDGWEYQDEGLLDRTHLRFFTQSSILALLSRSGYTVEAVRYDLPMHSKVGILNRVTLGAFRRILTSHYFIKACVAGS